MTTKKSQVFLMKNRIDFFKQIIESSKTSRIHDKIVP